MKVPELLPAVEFAVPVGCPLHPTTRSPKGGQNMDVKKLIDLLGRLPGDMVVRISVWGDSGDWEAHEFSEIHIACNPEGDLPNVDLCGGKTV